MLKMFKAILVDDKGEETTVRTYAQDTTEPEQILAPFLAGGHKLKSYEWIDTLSDLRRKWNEENPDIPIKVDA